MKFFQLFSIACSILFSLLCSNAAIAGTISFNFELRGKQCVVTNRGDSAAYYPKLFQLDHLGQWVPLKSDLNSSELFPNQSFSVELAEPSASVQKKSMSDLQIVMIRFFDQVGVSFGQVSVLRTPPDTRYKINAVYKNGKLILDLPEDAATIIATWVLVPLEEGIPPVLKPQSFTFNQPAAIRVDWKKTAHAEIETGKALPAAMLLHETPEGYALQILEKGISNPRALRTKWLRIKKLLYGAGIFCGIFGILLLAYVRKTDYGTPPDQK